MSAGLMKVTYKSIGGGQEFCEWLADTFCFSAHNEDGSTEIGYVEEIDFEKELRKKSKEFTEENNDEIKAVRKALKKDDGGCDFCISW